MLKGASTDIPNTQLWSTCILMLIYIIFVLLTAWGYWDWQQWGWGRGRSRFTRVGWSRQNIWAIGRYRWDWWGGVPESCRWNKLFREGISKQIKGLKLQDKGLALVQEAVAKHPLRALDPLLDAAVVGSRGGKTHPVASTGQHVMGKSSAPIPSDTCLPSPTCIPGPSTSTNTLTSVTPNTAIPSAQDIPNQPMDSHQD